MISIQVLVDKLNGFSSADEVALFLESQGVKGRRTCSSNCVISNWISRESGEPFINTTVSKVCAWNNDAQVFEDPKEVCLLSTNVAAFINLFDDGDYPNLALIFSAIE